MESIITITASHLNLPTYRPKYAILKNATVRQIFRFARKNPKCFVFPIATGTVDECHDYKGIIRGIKRDKRLHYVVQPFYVGNLSDQTTAIQSFISAGLGELSDCDEIIE